jgi:hypothetical protein
MPRCHSENEVKIDTDVTPGKNFPFTVEFSKIFAFYGAYHSSSLFDADDGRSCFSANSDRIGFILVAFERHYAVLSNSKAFREA